MPATKLDVAKTLFDEVRQKKVTYFERRNIISQLVAMIQCQNITSVSVSQNEKLHKTVNEEEMCF